MIHASSIWVPWHCSDHRLLNTDKAPWFFPVFLLVSREKPYKAVPLNHIFDFSLGTASCQTFAKDKGTTNQACTLGAVWGMVWPEDLWLPVDLGFLGFGWGMSGVGQPSILSAGRGG